MKFDCAQAVELVSNRSVNTENASLASMGILTELKIVFFNFRFGFFLL